MATKERPNGYYNHDRVLEIVAKCNDYTDFCKKYPGARQAAVNGGWLAEIKALLPHKTYWNRELCEKEIKEKHYNNKKEFRIGSPGAYSHAAKKGFLDEICKGMEVLGHYNNRRIYVYEFEDDYAYVGLTSNIKKRNHYHTHCLESPVYQHIKRSGTDYQLKIISDWMSNEEAMIYEEEMIKVYAACGWMMLNRKRGGDLGSAKNLLYSLDQLREASYTCQHRKEFKDKYPAMYAFILNHNLREKILGWMPKFYMPPLYWTDEKLHEAVVECKHSKKLLQKKYPGAYESILKKDRFEEFFECKRRRVVRRTREQAIEECRKYKSLSELMKSDQGLYTFIRRNNLQDECFKDLVRIDMHPNYVWEDILIAINASKNLTQMRKEHASEYRAALRVKEWRRELFKRLLPTSGEIQSVASDKISHSRVC